MKQLGEELPAYSSEADWKGDSSTGGMCLPPDLYAGTRWCFGRGIRPHTHLNTSKVISSKRGKVHAGRQVYCN
ncbi:hypothetical protein Y1Q_0017991 [Alligator mississippiensis]|uniref:Uncharacterized protein n=1 Tax=Alligator mississippiensis TaxID=8496 RepID=A0A151MY31_ALLMI|nr:hypothetical protein Y1Q_0017991 [Alligator mississippiensis]